MTWRRRGAAAALPELRWAAGGEGLEVTEVFPPEAPAWLAAECAAEAGATEEALADLRRFQRAYRPLGPWRTWAYPRSLLLEARLLDQLGRRTEARDALSRLEALWARADPDLPLVAEMKALRRRLGPGGQGAAPVAVRRPEPEGGCQMSKTQDGMRLLKTQTAAGTQVRIKRRELEDARRRSRPNSPVCQLTDGDCGLQTNNLGQIADGDPVTSLTGRRRRRSDDSDRGGHTCRGRPDQRGHGYLTDRATPSPAASSW